MKSFSLRPQERGSLVHEGIGQHRPAKIPYEHWQLLYPHYGQRRHRRRVLIGLNSLHKFGDVRRQRRNTEYGIRNTRSDGKTPVMGKHRCTLVITKSADQECGLRATHCRTIVRRSLSSFLFTFSNDFACMGRSAGQCL